MRIPVLGSLLLFAASCAAFGSRDPDSIDHVERANAGRHIELALAEIETGQLVQATERLIEVHDVRRLTPEERNRTDELLESCVGRLLEERSGEGFDSSDLQELYELDLPTRLRARAGVLAARRMLEEGSRIRAYRMIQKVETALPNHTERTLAGDVLVDAGLSLAGDDRRYNLLFSYRARGVQALEYLVVTYPFNRRCDLAYHTLALVYEEQDEVRDAIARYEDLVIYHPESPYAVTAQARLPAMRMALFERDDYDRGELLLARQELEAWLANHPGHELEPAVRESLGTCRFRLTRSDLILARYYRRIGNAFGARLHAERALAEAEGASADELSREARELLADLPETKRTEGIQDPEPEPEVEDS